MGFIENNKNTFEVYLTDLGKQKFFDGGLKDAITHFSICDDDSNYELFSPNSDEILPYITGTTYEIDSYVKYNESFYKCKKQVIGTVLPSTGTTYWTPIKLFKPSQLTQQSIPILNHIDKQMTSMDGTYLYDVFVQVPLRGKTENTNKELLGIKANTQRNYILYEPTLDLNKTLGILSYIIR